MYAWASLPWWHLQQNEEARTYSDIWNCGEHRGDKYLSVKLTAPIKDTALEVALKVKRVSWLSDLEADISHNRGKIPVSVVSKFHLICFQLGQQQHQDLDEYEENDLQHTSKADWREMQQKMSNIKIYMKKMPLRMLLSTEKFVISHASDYTWH